MPQDEDASIVFFAKQSAVYVHIVKVQQVVGAVRLYYQVIPHETRDLTTHFALVPVKGLRAGRQKIEIIQIPFTHPNLADEKILEDASRICRGSMFFVHPTSVYPIE